MTPKEREVIDALTALVEAVHRQDVRAYREMVVDDVSSFETDIAPHRIDNIEFHINLMSQKSQQHRANIRADILTPRVQLYGDFAIVTYTLLATLGDKDIIEFQTTNETRVFVKEEGRWKMAHLHRSEA